MRPTYVEFVRDSLNEYAAGMPIYTKKIAKKIAETYGLQQKEAAAAAAVAIKRILDGAVVPELRCYQKGVYYLTTATPFGETGINKEQLIADKYLLPDIGYETGLSVLHQIGLTTQMPRERVLATNVAKNCIRTDRKLGVIIRPPKVKITAENRPYLRVLDVLDVLEKAPVDAERPYTLVADYIRRLGLQYDALLAMADEYYNLNTVLKLAHTASAGGAL